MTRHSGGNVELDAGAEAHRLDVVVALGEGHLQALHPSLARLDGYVDSESMRRAIRD